MSRATRQCAEEMLVLGVEAYIRELPAHDFDQLVRRARLPDVQQVPKSAPKAYPGAGPTAGRTRNGHRDNPHTRSDDWKETLSNSATQMSSNPVAVFPHRPTEQANEVFPHRAGYIPPAFLDGVPPSPVTAAAVATNGTVAEQAHAALAHAAKAFEKHLVDTEAVRDRYSETGYAEQIDMFTNTEAARAADTAVDKVKQRVDTAAAAVEKIRRDLSPDGDTAAELRASRYWSRVQRLFDSHDTDKLIATARTIIDEAECAELGILMQELGPYLTSRGAPTDWIDAVIAKAVPEYGNAKTQQAKARNAHVIAESNAAALRRAFAQRRPAILADGRKYDPDR